MSAGTAAWSRTAAQRAPSSSKSSGGRRLRAPAAARSLIAESHAALVASPEAREEVFVFPSDQSCVVSASDGGARRAYAWLDGRAASLRECAERVDRLRGGEGFL